MKKSNGFAVILVVIIIFVVGLAIGGLFYFLGSQNSSKDMIPEQTQIPEATETPSPTPSPAKDVSDSKDLNIISGEIDGTTVDSIEADLKDIDNDASNFK